MIYATWIVGARAGEGALFTANRKSLKKKKRKKKCRNGRPVIAVAHKVYTQLLHIDETRRDTRFEIKERRTGSAESNYTSNRTMTHVSNV